MYICFVYTECPIITEFSPKDTWCNLKSKILVPKYRDYNNF